MKKSILVLALSAALLAGCSDSSDVTDTTAKPTVEQTSATTKPAEKAEAPVKQRVVTIDLKLNDLKDRYNKFADEFNKTNTGLVLKSINEITDLRLGNEAQALYQGCSTKYTCLSGLYDTASGKIISISVIGNPSKEEATGLVALSHLIVGTSAATPSAPKFNSLTKVVSELIDGQGYFIKETTFEGYHYEFRRDDVIGNELTVKKLP